MISIICLPKLTIAIWMHDPSQIHLSSMFINIECGVHPKTTWNLEVFTLWTWWTQIVIPSCNLPLLVLCLCFLLKEIMKKVKAKDLCPSNMLGCPFALSTLYSFFFLRLRLLLTGQTMEIETLFEILVIMRTLRCLLYGLFPFFLDSRSVDSLSSLISIPFLLS